MSEIEPIQTVEQDGTNVRVTQDWTSVLDKMARDIADKLDEATLARLGYVKQGTCHDAAGKQMAFFACSACGATIERKHPRFCHGCGRKVVYE